VLLVLTPARRTMNNVYAWQRGVSMIWISKTPISWLTLAPRSDPRMGVCIYRMLACYHVATSSDDRLGSFAAGPHTRPSTAAFGHKGDIQAAGIIGLGSAAFGHKQTFADLQWQWVGILR
jgi:hypothetical protein